MGITIPSAKRAEVALRTAEQMRVVVYRGGDIEKDGAKYELVANISELKGYAKLCVFDVKFFAREIGPNSKHNEAVILSLNMDVKFIKNKGNGSFEIGVDLSRERFNDNGSILTKMKFNIEGESAKRMFWFVSGEDRSLKNIFERVSNILVCRLGPSDMALSYDERALKVDIECMQNRIAAKTSIVLPVKNRT